MLRASAKLAELGISLTTPMPPIANYVPYVVTGNLVAVSGQVPAIDAGKMKRVAAVIHGELFAIVIILLCAAIMARGGWI